MTLLFYSRANTSLVIVIGDMKDIKQITVARELNEVNQLRDYGDCPKSIIGGPSGQCLTF